MPASVDRPVGGDLLGDDDRWHGILEGQGMISTREGCGEIVMRAVSSSVPPNLRAAEKQRPSSGLRRESYTPAAD